MRWYKKKLAPKEGEERVINRFLVFPLTLKGQTRWWERARVRQTRHYVITGGDMLSDSYGWRWFNENWVDS